MPVKLYNMNLLVIMLLSCGTAIHGLPCALRHTNDGFVCVCNGTFCDTIEPVPKPLDSNAFVQYTTSKAGKVFEIFHGSFNQPDTAGDQGCHITINPQEKYQEIFGFGGSFTDAAGINIASLSEGAQHNLMSCYFGKDGIGYKFGRVPIGGSDFSTRPYTLADEPDDLELENFKLAPEDYSYKMPYIKMAREMSSKPLHLIGSAWSAPIWMKTNNRITGFGFLKKNFYRLWAQYHVKFLEAYQAEGIPFWAITTGNEPINAYFFKIIKFNSMGWHAEDQGEWVANDLGPLLRDSNFNSCKIIAMDDQRFVLPIWAHKMLSVDKATDFVQGFGLHWYYDKQVPAKVLSFVHDRHPDKFIMNTEACEGPFSTLGSQPWEKAVVLGSWKRGSNYMDDIIEDLNHYVSAWVDWNLALNEQGAPNWVENFVDSAILVNATRDEFYKQPMFYALAHCSTFLDQLASRIGFEMKGQPFYSREQCKHVFATVAVNQDGGVVVIINNRGNSQKKVILVDPIKGKAEVNLDPHSFNTILYWN